jgi:hypothetical protein
LVAPIEVMPIAEALKIAFLDRASPVCIGDAERNAEMFRVRTTTQASPLLHPAKKQERPAAKADRRFPQETRVRRCAIHPPKTDG